MVNTAIRFAMLVALLGLGLAGPARGGAAGRRAAVATARASASALTIAQTGSFAGNIRYTLTCDPAGGTLPRPARACAALAADTSLLTAVPAGTPFPCPFGQSSFDIRGTYQGRPVAVQFAACTSGQGPVAAHWADLAPSAISRVTVAPGRGIGLWRLGDPESLVRSELGRGKPAGPPCRSCRRVYPLGTGQTAEVGNHFFTVALTVQYAARRIVRVETNNPAALIGGTALSSGQALRRRLRSWRRLACPHGTEELVRGRGPSTIVAFTRYVTKVAVQRAAPACL